MPDDVITVSFSATSSASRETGGSRAIFKDARADFKIINGENMAGGLGITPTWP